MKNSYPEILDEVMTSNEVAAEFDIDDSTVRHAIRAGRIAGRQSGKTWLVRREDAEAQWGNPLVQAKRPAD